MAQIKLFAPPYPNEDAFFCRFFTEVSSLRDEAGRPLHEVDFREGGDAYASCPFHDSRHGYLMNRAALSQIAGEWSEIVAGVNFYASLFCGPTDFSRAWRISLASMFAPLYLLHRSTQRFADGALPTCISGVFKIMLDVPTTMDLMLMTEADGLAHSMEKSLPQQIQDYADSKLVLLNGDYACAGSPGLIKTIVSSLFQPPEALVAQYGRFADCISNREEFLTFCFLMSQQYVVGLIYLQSTWLAMERAFSQLGGPAPTFSERLSAYERRRRIALQSLVDSNAETLGRFAQLVRESHLWGVTCPLREADSALETSRLFLESTVNCDAELITGAYEHYREAIEGSLLRIQTTIAETIGSNSMFPASVHFGDPLLHPAHQLKARVSSTSL